MEHSTAILEDARQVVEGGESSGPPSQPAAQQADAGSEAVIHDAVRKQNGDNQRKRKGDIPGDRQQHGSRGGRYDSKRHKKGDMGRGEYFRDGPDKRQRNTDSREKQILQQHPAPSTYGVAYTLAEIAAEERRPKRKVAVLIGYSGTGYKGMQITPHERTIEGDLFTAFIRAGAISKANADDPKKAGLVRCARTDKGVHAAGNMISLKLIVEEEDIVAKINSELPPQIRIWGIERTTGGFSCYQACDSRWYEYLVPSHAFLPPHPSSWLARKLEAMADEAGDGEGYEARQAEVKGFWEGVEEREIRPVLEGIDEDIRWEVVKALQGEDEASAKAVRGEGEGEGEGLVRVGKSVRGEAKGEREDHGGSAKDEEVGGGGVDGEETEEAAIIINDPSAAGIKVQPIDAAPSVAAAETTNDSATAVSDQDTAPVVATMVDSAVSLPPLQPSSAPTDPSPNQPTTRPQLSPESLDRLTRLRAATKLLRQAYILAKRRYRIPAQRISRIQSALGKFVGTNNFHNYTVQKTFRDPSAKRHIKSFVVGRTPILIGKEDGRGEIKVEREGEGHGEVKVEGEGEREGHGEEGSGELGETEWLSLKVHGQSFMMHQIRKMVGMVALLVRSGSNLTTLTDSLGPEKFSIPKVPGLGLLLERPVFDSYNNLQAKKHGRDKLRFAKYEKEIEEFKQREIYRRIFREEEERNEFGRFFNHVDNFKEGYFLYVTSKGLAACKDAGAVGGKGKVLVEESDGEGGGGDG